jgi:hypothetical protein
MFRKLSVLLIGIFLVLAGCAGSPGEELTKPFDDEVTHEVIVKNTGEASHTVAVEVRHGGETVLDEQRNLTGGAEWDVTTQSEAGNYTVVVSTGAGTTVNESYTLPLAEGDRKSFTTVRVNESGGLDVRTSWQE